MPKTIAIGLTHPGTVRNRNEDAFFLLDKVVPGLSGGIETYAVSNESAIQFFAIADGMGGRGIGDAAARIALAELDAARRKIKNPDRFEFPAFASDYIHRANQAVLKAMQQWQGLYAGTALVLLCLVEESAFVLSLGNCRCYRLREGTLTCLTVDDVLPNAHPRRLSRFLGQLPENRPAEAAQSNRFPLQKEDVFLLTTDGLTDQISDDAIADRLNAPDAFVMKPDKLMNVILAKDATDNLSLLLLRVLDPKATGTVSQPPTHPPRHRQKPRHVVAGSMLRAILILLACILTGFVFSWLILAIFL